MAALAMMLGIFMTTWAVLAHLAIVVAPGALLITAGGAWLGNALARHHVHLIPSAIEVSQESNG